MTCLTRVVLDVLKPHSPNALQFANAVADNNPGCEITVVVTEVDEKTESTLVSVKGQEINYERLVESIMQFGGSVHSIDEVTVSNMNPTTP